MSPLLRLLRPHQWTKNAFCLAGLVFGGKWADPPSILRAFATVVVFCGLSSCVYVLNDIHDRETDRVHPKKRFRPLASGEVSIKSAITMALILGMASMLGAFLLGKDVAICSASYLILSVSYTWRLKHTVVLDVICIALGFVLRTLSGVLALAERPSSWIVLCTFFLALFLGFAKRRGELAALDALGERSRKQRRVLNKYRVPLLDSLINSSGSMTIICYALFCAASGRNPTLVLTVPVVCYAIMRYTLLAQLYRGADEPERVLSKDFLLIISMVVWLISYMTILLCDVRLVG